MIVFRLLPILLTSEVWLPVAADALSSSDTASLPFHHATVVSAEDLQDLIQSPSVSFVYFSDNDSPKISAFLQNYDKAAKYLKIYNVILALYNCTSSTSDHDLCKNEAAANKVYTFQNGAQLLTLTLEMLPDVDSIMANALQIILLHQVPIIQSGLELRGLEKDALGRRDILFAYSAKFGTEDHRIFLEVAYTFHEDFQFALTTDVKVTQSLQSIKNQETASHFSMWILYCAESRSVDEAAVSCDNVVYTGEVSFTALAQFIKRLLERNLYHAPADGVSTVFELSDTLPIVFLYASKDEQEKLPAITKFVRFDLRGYAKLVLVDMDNEECTAWAKQQGLSGRLPSVAIKQNGVMVFMDQTKRWSLRNVRKFIISVVFPENDQDFENDSEETESFENQCDCDYSKLSDGVQKQDDQIASAVLALHAEEMKLDHIPALMKQDFYKIVPYAHLKFVLFYLPFDHISLAFLREFGHASEILAKNFSDTSVLARVNCYDATDLCTAENITAFPILRIYQKGQDHVIYKGSLDAKSVVRAVKLLQLNSPVHLVNEQEVKNFIKGEHPKSFHKFTPSSVLLLASTEKSDEEDVFLDVSKNWSIITAFGVVHGDVAKSVAKTYGVHVPSVLAFHRSDRDKPIRVLSEKLSRTSLTNFAKNSIIYTVPKLTAMNLPTLFARKQPFVILFLDPSGTDSKVAKDMFTKLAMTGQFDNIIFCWIEAQANTMGERILSEYTWSATLPMITLVDHGKGELFNYQPQLLKVEDTTEWLSAVLAKKIKPSKMLQYARWGPPGPYYDFLTMMDEMEKGKKQKVRLQSEDLPQSDLNQEEAPDAESEPLENFRQLQKSIVYRQNLEQHEGSRNRKPHLVKKESYASHLHHHAEL
ncbi:hypothetical protein BsWGS_10712 [Bradybaena similaris]